MDKVQLVYSGNSKNVFSTADAGFCILEFTDGAKKQVAGKGACNAAISARLFELLEKKGVPTHFEKLLTGTEMLVRRLEIIPLEVVVRNAASGTMAPRLGIEPGIMLEEPVLELYYKNAALQDPLVNEYHVHALKIARKEQVERIKELAFKANALLSEFLEARGMLLIDCRFEFGLREGKVVMGDEVSPETCRMWDRETRERLGREGGEEAYKEALKRIMGKNVGGVE